MKKILLLLSLVIISTIISFGQDALVFSKVIQTDSIGKAKLFAAIHDWFATTYNSANDVIQMADKEEGTIIGNGSMTYKNEKLGVRLL